MTELKAALREHYSRHSIYQTVVENLQRKGISLARVQPQDLFPYDQFHAGGIASTHELALRAAIPPQACVVDVGCGAGGAARYLRVEFGCRVIGIELSLETLETARQLNQLVGITSGLSFIAAQADSLPLPSQIADIVWTQHVTMNLPDHAAFLRDCARVLKPSGRYVCHEWLRNRAGALPFPLPWAPTPPLSHVIAADEFLQLLKDQQFSPEAEDVTPAMQDALERDMDALAVAAAPAAAERIPRLRNLIQAARDSLLCCWIIVAPKS